MHNVWCCYCVASSSIVRRRPCSFSPFLLSGTMYYVCSAIFLMGHGSHLEWLKGLVSNPTYFLAELTQEQSELIHKRISKALLDVHFHPYGERWVGAHFHHRMGEELESRVTETLLISQDPGKINAKRWMK